MGHNIESGNKISNPTFVEAETRLCIKESVDMPQLINNLQIPNAKLLDEAKASESIRHIVYAGDNSTIQRLGSNHVTVILNGTDQYSGYVRPKRLYTPSFTTDPLTLEAEIAKFETKIKKAKASCKIELPIIHFDSPEKKREAITEALFQVGVNNPQEFTYSRPFIKSRYTRLYSMQNGLILDVAGDRIITPDKTLSKIEFEIAKPYPPNAENIKILEEATEHSEKQLKNNGFTLYNGKSNSKIMHEYKNPENRFGEKEIEELKARADQEADLSKNASKQPLAA